MSGVITGKEKTVWMTCQNTEDGCTRRFGQAYGFVTVRFCPECIAALAAEFWRVSRGRRVSPAR